MNFLLKIVVSALAVFIVANFLPGVQVDNYWSALMVAIVLAFLNTIVKPILTMLTIPITVFSLGLFLLVINAFIIICAEKLVKGFSVNGFFTALFFSIILSLCTGILNVLFGVNNNNEEE